jgi:hypothetical protein
MIVWLTYNKEWDDYDVFTVEPRWYKGQQTWDISSRLNHLTLRCLCGIGVCALFDTVPEENECCEYDLSGPKPKLIETWLPPD